MACHKPKQYFPLGVSLFLMIGITLLFIAFPARLLVTEQGMPWWIHLLPSFVFLITLINFTTAALLDPGRYPKCAKPEDGKDDINAPVYKGIIIHDEYNVQMKWCSTCKFYRPPRVTHCSQCDACTEKFDHHCPWLNNCIGRRNYKFFFSFLILLCVYMFVVFILALVYVINHSSQTGIDYIIAIVVVVLVAVLKLPVYALTAFHVFLVVNGRTTNEQVSGKIKDGNPFDEGCAKNCQAYLCVEPTPFYLKKQPDLRFLDINNTKKNSTTKFSGNPPEKCSIKNTKNGHHINNEVPFSPNQQRQSSNIPSVIVKPADVKVDFPQQDLKPDRFRAKVTPVSMDKYTIEVHHDGSINVMQPEDKVDETMSTLLSKQPTMDSIQGSMNSLQPNDSAYVLSKTNNSDSMRNLMDNSSMAENSDYAYSLNLPRESSTSIDDLSVEENFNNCNNARTSLEDIMEPEVSWGRKLSEKEITDHQKIQLENVLKQMDAEVALLQDELDRDPPHTNGVISKRSNSTPDHRTTMLEHKPKYSRFQNGRRGASLTSRKDDGDRKNITRSQSEECYIAGLSRFEKLPKIGHVSAIIGQFELSSSASSSRPTSQISSYSKTSQASSNKADTVALLAK